MANVFTFTALVALTLLGAESCFIPGSLYLLVPQRILPGDEVARVGTANCDRNTLRLTSTDENFILKPNGSLVAVKEVYVGTGRRTFYVRAQDASGPGSEMEVHLVHGELPQPAQEGILKRSKRSWNSQPFNILENDAGPLPKPIEKPAQEGILKRSKRRWSPPPFNILENDAGPFPKPIDTIVSDSAVRHDVFYTLSGPGYTETPVGIFAFNKDTAKLSVLQSVDREMYPNFTLTVSVFDKFSKQPTDLPLEFYVLVDDVNDNAPEFRGPLQYTVLEQSKSGTVVGKVEATDRDEVNSRHVLIKYSLLSGSELFAIDPATGVITTLTGTLDRETKDHHLVTVQIKDMYGEPNGLFNTATATITVGDINDNPPTFTKTTYNAEVVENEQDKLILRIPVEDKDLRNTPNWISKFLITKGNEKGNFRIETDPKTNDGLLYIAKPLNYEQNKNVKLEVLAQNEAELSNPAAKWQTVPIDIAVTDVDECPEFTPPTISIKVKENTANGTVIGKYTAVDPETKSSDGIRYYKLTDPASWINVDTNTGELKVANTIDRESRFVQNGTYSITMKAVDGACDTGMGTVIIQVADVNDNVPTLLPRELVICEKDGELGSVVIVAEDKDESPFSEPFSFTLPPDSDGKWTVVSHNKTAATLRHIKHLPLGIYTVPVHITDLQGHGKTQPVTVRICQCRNGVCLAKDRSVSLGGLGVLALLLPLLLLLLLFLLLCFFCATSREKRELEDTGDSGGILLKSNTEGKGDQVDSSLIIVPNTGLDEITKGSVRDVNTGYGDIKGGGTLMGAQNMQDNWRYKSDMHEFSQYDQYGGQIGGQLGGQFGGHLTNSGVSFEGRQFLQDSSLLRIWQTNGNYLFQKLGYLGTEEDGRYADDIVHTYGFEGQGSAAGSIGCCSEFDDGDNLDFLNTLGPKFKTLAGVCRKT